MKDDVGLYEKKLKKKDRDATQTGRVKPVDEDEVVGRPGRGLRVGWVGDREHDFALDVVGQV